MTFIPKAVAAYKVSGNLVLPTGEHVITFKISSLTPVERSRWLGNPSTAEEAAMKCILHMQAGDRASAKLFAASSGPLADAFTKLAEATPNRHEPEGS